MKVTGEDEGVIMYSGGVNYGKDLLPLEAKVIENAALVLSLRKWAEFCPVEIGGRLAKWRISLNKV